MRRAVLGACVALACASVGPVVENAAAQAPVDNLAPEVVGQPLLGERLVCGAGSWTGTITKFTYEWMRDAIPVGNELTYIITSADEGHSLWCVVTAVSSEGSAEAESSNSVAIPGGTGFSPPVEKTPPELSGKPALGETLNCSTGTWGGTPPPSFTYQWIRDVGASEVVLEPTTSTYKVQAEDEGHSLTCRVTASNVAGSASALTSTVRVPGTKPEERTPPQVLGIEPVAFGEGLTCSPGTWNGAPAPTFAYLWVRDRGLPDQAVIGPTSASTYTVQLGDELHSLSCTVIATNSVGSSEASSTNSVRVRGSKPENTSAPRVSGTPMVGDALTCEPGTWSGVPTPTYAYVWIRDSGTPQEEAIGSATSATYTARTEDRGDSLTCEVTASNSEGSTSSSSAKVVVPASTGGTAPENKLAPSVSGKALLGSQLTCSPGTWTGTPTPLLTYQWLRDNSPIASATARTYLIVEADQGHTLSCQVTAVNSEGVASAESSDVLEVPGRAPEDLEAPEVSGRPALGESLTCLHGTWAGAPTPVFTYQWLRDGSEIASATAGSYTVTSEDRGAAITCEVTATNSAGAARATSSNDLEIPGGAPASIVSPEVLGTANVGNTLSCAPGTWNGAPVPTYSFQWLLNGVAIPEANTSTFTVAPADRGLLLACEVTAANREGTASATSDAIHVPGIKPTDVEAPQVSGSATVGQQLICDRGIWNGQPPPTFTYRWVRDGTTIVSTAGSAYTVTLADEGHLLSCVVTATNSEGTTEVESSTAVAIPTPAAHVETRPVATFPPTAKASTVHPPPSTAQIIADLRTQLTRAARGAHISSLRKHGTYVFSFAAPAAGKLELAWYEAPSHTRHAVDTKPLLLATCSATFTRAGTKVVTLRLTTAGRRLVIAGKRIPLTVKSAFIEPHKRPVTWLNAFVLDY